MPISSAPHPRVTRVTRTGRVDRPRQPSAGPGERPHRDGGARCPEAAVPPVALLGPVVPQVLAELDRPDERVVADVGLDHAPRLEGGAPARRGVAGHERLVGAGVEGGLEQVRVHHPEAEARRAVTGRHVAGPRVAPSGHLLVEADGDVAGNVAGVDVPRGVLVGREGAPVAGEVGDRVVGDGVVGRGASDPDALLHVVALRRAGDVGDRVARDRPAVAEVAQPDPGPGPAGDVVDRVARDDAVLVHRRVDALEADVVVGDRDPQRRLEGPAHLLGQVRGRGEDAGPVVAAPAGHRTPRLPVRLVLVEPAAHASRPAAHDHDAATDRQVGDVPVAGTRTEADRPVAVRRAGAAAGHLQRRGEHDRAARRREGDRAGCRAGPLDLQLGRVGAGGDGDGVARAGVGHRTLQLGGGRDAHRAGARRGARRRGGGGRGRCRPWAHGSRLGGPGGERSQHESGGGGSGDEQGPQAAGGLGTGRGRGLRHANPFHSADQGCRRAAGTLRRGPQQGAPGRFNVVESLFLAVSDRTVGAFWTARNR